MPPRRPSILPPEEGAVQKPTGYGLLTGRYCWRTWAQWRGVWANDPLLIDTKRLTLPGQLYNLADDPAERNNLYEKPPEVVARLTRLLDQTRKSGRSRSRPTLAEGRNLGPRQWETPGRPKQPNPGIATGARRVGILISSCGNRPSART